MQRFCAATVRQGQRLQACERLFDLIFQHPSPARRQKGFQMKINPCRKCHGEKKDKNNPVCRDCKKRIAYISYLELALSYVPSYGEIQASPWPTGAASNGIAAIPFKPSVDC